MNDLKQLIEAVHASGVTIRVEGGDLKIKPVGVLPPDLKTRLREHKPELLALLQTKELEESMRRLEAADILLAISEDGDLRIVHTDADAHEAVQDRFTVYSPRDAYMYVTLTEHERLLLHKFKKGFGASIEWKRAEQ